MSNWITEKRITTMMMIMIIIISINISMACEMCELCDFFPKVRGTIELELTENLTDPCSISQISQEPPIILRELLHLDG